MENIERRKYNSKYAGLSETERQKKYRENAKEWKKKVGAEKQYGYLHGHCDVCDSDYANIYEHRKSKKHQKNEENKNTKDKKTVVEQLSDEDKKEAEHIEVLLKV